MTCRHPATEDDATGALCQELSWLKIFVIMQLAAAVALAVISQATGAKFATAPSVAECTGSQAAEGKVCSDLSVEECTGFILHEDQYIQCKVTGKSADESQCLSVGPICDYEVESAISGWFLNALMPPVSSRRLGWLQAD
eukprot:s6399_g4.t3